MPMKTLYDCDAVSFNAFGRPGENYFSRFFSVIPQASFHRDAGIFFKFYRVQNGFAFL